MDSRFVWQFDVFQVFRLVGVTGPYCTLQRNSVQNCSFTVQLPARIFTIVAIIGRALRACRNLVELCKPNARVLVLRSIWFRFNPKPLSCCTASVYSVICTPNVLLVMNVHQSTRKIVMIKSISEDQTPNFAIHCV